MMQATASAIDVTVNFSRNRDDAGIYSQWSPELVKLDLEPVRTRLVSMRQLSPAPALDREGFTLASHPVTGDWSDKAWLEGAYADSCLDLVKRLTGARAALNMYFPILRSTLPAEGAIETAGFIHIDQDRTGYAAQGAARARECGHEMNRGAIYNVWKAISPPPQDQPLALADWRAFDPSQFVPGMNIEKGAPAGTPFYGLAVPEEQPTLYYAPDMTPEESLVFVAGDFDPEHPLGCAHTSVRLPDNGSGMVPRASVEVRVLVLFD